MRIPLSSILVLALAASPSIFAQSQPKVRIVRAKYTPPSSGAQMYRAYCAACHGVNGDGNGPAAAALKSAPTDLTRLSERNSGKFPGLQVQQSISGDFATRAHGSPDMPSWGDIFKSLSDRNVITLRVKNLTDYIATIQRQ